MYMCVLASNRECDGCMECEEQHKSREELMRWDRWEDEYDNYRDDMYEREFEQCTRF